jgi:hypothetical protein
LVLPSLPPPSLTVVDLGREQFREIDPVGESGHERPP